MPRLIAFPETPEAREIPLKPGTNSLGRGEGNDAVIPHPSVSSRHCEVMVTDGVVRLKDLGSTNGSFVNRAPITEATLQPGQRIQLGSVELLFEGDGAPAVASPPIAVRVVPQARLAVALAAPVEEPPAPVVPEHALCKYHPKSPARWLCPQCHKTYCDLCVTTRPGAGAAQRICRGCSVACTPLHVSFEVAAPKSFFRELPRAVVYPFRGTGIMILIAATLLFAALDFMSRGLIGFFLKAVALGYLYSFVQTIIHSTASEDEQMPGLPGMDDVLGGCFRLLGTVLISFGPALGLAYLAIAQEMPAAGVALIPAVIFGCLYFPMAFLAVAVKDNVMAANPLVVVPSILRVPVEYLVTAVLLAGVFGVRWLGDALSSGVAHQSLMTSSMSEMFLLFGFRATWAFVSVYLLTVTTRILGLLYMTKRDRLGW